MLGLGLDALDLGSSLSWEVVLGPPPSVVHKTTNISTFEVVCGLNPLYLFYLLLFPNPQKFVPKEKVTKTEYVKIHKRNKEHYKNQKRNFVKSCPKQ